MVRPAAVQSGGKEYTGDRQTDAVWQRLRTIGGVLQNSPFINGRLITEEDDAPKGSGLSFTGGTPRTIAHRLGRRAVGFLEVYAADVPSPALVLLRPVAFPAGKSSDQFVSVESDGSGACFLWVF
jgi:hypothetical protein